MLAGALVCPSVLAFADQTSNLFYVETANSNCASVIQRIKSPRFFQTRQDN